ncbi:copper resistance protein CopC [Nakamurella sp.]|uniref:copper resistance protein CopC n=1 Tax=Nakamurella sp. TaxID=1869182 RepID=UPI003783BC4D
MTLETVGFRRRWGMLALLVPVLTVLSVVAAPAAWAHSSLISSSPAADSVLATPPTRIDLVFNEEIRDFQPKIAITVGDADPVEVTPVVDGATVSADLTGTPLPTVAGAGSVAWKIGYRVVSADGHPVSGLVPFSVGDGPAASATGTATSTGAPAAAGTGAAPAVPADQDSSGWLWVGGAAVVVAALLVAIVLLRRRRPGSDPGSAPGGTPDRAAGGQ